MKKAGRILKIFAVILFVLIAVAAAEWFALKGAKDAFDELLLRDAMNSASVMLVACRTVYEFQVLRELEREQLLVEAAQHVPDTISPGSLELVREAGRLPLVILADSTGQILDKSGAVMADIYPWLGRLPENLPGVFGGFVEREMFGIDRELPLTEGPKGLALKTAWGILILFAPEPTIRERENLTVGRLIGHLGENPNVRYITLQDDAGFIFATKSVTEMTSLTADSFLTKVRATGRPDSRYTEFSGERVFELAIDFPRMGLYRGILRIGLSTSDYERLYRSYAIQIGIILLLVLAVTIAAAVLLRTTRRLAVQKGLSDAILSEMGAACVAVDADGIITLINPVASRIFGIPVREAVGAIFEDVLPGDPLRLGDVLGKGTGGLFTTEIPSGDNERQFDVSTGKLPDGGAFAVAEDITGLNALRKEAAGAEHLRALGELAAGVAHEIRNPLNAIGIAAQRLSNEFEPVEDRAGYSELLGGVRREIGRLDNVIREFIGLSAPMAPDISYRPLTPLLEEIVLDAGIRAGGKNIEFTSEIEEIGPAHFDPEQLKKALINLIKNAVEATPDGGRMSLTAELRESTISISIWDNGPPIPDSVREKLGKPFVSAGKESGTGIGLFVAFRIARDHGGKIEYESGESGTTFSFILPRPEQ